MAGRIQATLSESEPHITRATHNTELVRTLISTKSVSLLGLLGTQIISPRHINPFPDDDLHPAPGYRVGLEFAQAYTIPPGYRVGLEFEPGDPGTPPAPLAASGRYSWQTAAAFDRAVIAMVQPHPTAQTLRILPRYRAAPWHWASLTPDVELPSAVVQVEGLEPVTYTGYNRIYLSGTGDGGVLADATVYYVRIEAA